MLKVNNLRFCPYTGEYGSVKKLKSMDWLDRNHGVVSVPSLLTLNITPCSSVSIVNFEQEITG